MSTGKAMCWMLAAVIGISTAVWAAEAAPGGEGRGRRGGGAAPAGPPRARSVVQVQLPPPAFPTQLLPDSPFGINTAFGPGTADLIRRLEGFQQVGIKWGRQGFSWRAIERENGVYDFSAYDQFVDTCHKYGLSLFGQLSGPPPFHNYRTPEGVAAYARFAAACARHYRGKVDHWQILNEPNNAGQFKEHPEQYAALLAAAGKAIHEANPDAKVLGMNTAFIDTIWIEKILSMVPYDCFDILCVHPYRSMSAPEDKLDWWQKDQYVGAYYKGILDETWPMIRQGFLEQVAELDKVMAKFGALKPVWVTEICWNTNIHPYGTPEIRQADMLVRFYVLAMASQRVQKVFWWTYRDSGSRQYDMADMVGIVRNNYEPKYAYFAYAFMTRMLEGKKWVRNERLGPDIFLVVFDDEKANQEIMVAWANRPYAYIRVGNTQAGLTFYDVYGTMRFVEFDPVRTASLPVPLGESPIYIVGPRGLKANVRPDPGW
jgi:hypothetical protein